MLQAAARKVAVLKGIIGSGCSPPMPGRGRGSCHAWLASLTSSDYNPVVLEVYVDIYCSRTLSMYN